MQDILPNIENDSQVLQVWVGVDPGGKRTGIATAAPGSILATPHSVLPTCPLDSFAARLLEHLTPRVPIGFAVGLPIDPRGREGESAQLARDLGSLLEAELVLPVHYVDERYTSKDTYARRKEAGFKARKIRKDLDAHAAAMILQSWLDMGGPAAT